MDWITFIKWNGVVYVSYYGANLLVDYLQTKRAFSPKSSIHKYRVSGIDQEELKKVKSSDVLYIDRESEEKYVAHTTTKSKNNPKRNIQFNAPIERQGMPMEEFLKFAGKSGNAIFQPNI